MYVGAHVSLSINIYKYLYVTLCVNIFVYKRCIVTIVWNGTDMLLMCTRTCCVHLY